MVTLGNHLSEAELRGVPSNKRLVKWRKSTPCTAIVKHVGWLRRKKGRTERKRRSRRRKKRRGRSRRGRKGRRGRRRKGRKEKGRRQKRGGGRRGQDRGE